jgi:hypothetical protein
MVKHSMQMQAQANRYTVYTVVVQYVNTISVLSNMPQKT